jgi:hypothetical protein
VRVCRKVARQPAQQGYKPHTLCLYPRHQGDAGRKCAPVAHTNQPGEPAFDFAGKVGRTGKPEGPDRHRVVVQIRDHFAVLQAEPRCEHAFQRHAFGDLAVDDDLDRTFLVGTHDQPVRLDPRHTQPLCDLGLREPTGIVQPSRPNGEALVIVPLCDILHGSDPTSGVCL